MRKALIFLGFLVSAFLFAQKAYAVPAYTMNTASTTQCLSNAGVSCSTGSVSAQSGYNQEIAFPLSSPDFTSIEINDIDLNYQTADGSTNSYITLFNSNNILLATSQTATTATGWVNYVFSPAYIINSSSVSSTTPAYFRINYPTVRADRLYLSGQFNYGSPFYGTFSDDYRGSFPDQYQLFAHTEPEGTPLTNPIAGVTTVQQLAFRINGADVPTELAFTYPTDNSIITSPFTFLGTCDTDFDFQAYTGGSFASSTQAFGSTRTCSAGTFSIYSGLLSSGIWTFTASSTGQFDALILQVVGRSQEPYVDFSDNPLAGTEGADLGYWGFLRDWASRAMDFRPYSYFFDIQSAFVDALENPTSTLPMLDLDINTSTVEYASSTFPFDINFTAIAPSDFTRIITAEQWASIQWLMKILITLPWLIWFILRIKRYFGI